MQSRILKTAALILALSSSVAAQEASKWAIQCEGDVCVSQMRADQAESDISVATMTFQSMRKSAEINIFVTLPLGTALEPGIQVVAQGQSFGMPFKVCLPTGCTANAPLDPELRLILESGSDLSIRFFSQTDAAPKAVNLPTQGLTTVFASMDE